MGKSILLKTFLIAWILVVVSVALMVVDASAGDPSGIMVSCAFLPFPVILIIATIWFLTDINRLIGFAQWSYFFLSMLYSVIYWRLFFGTVVVGQWLGRNITFAEEPWHLKQAYRSMLFMIGSRDTWIAGFELIMIPLSLLLPVLAMVSIYQISRQILHRSGKP